MRVNEMIEMLKTCNPNAECELWISKLNANGIHRGKYYKLTCNGHVEGQVPNTSLKSPCVDFEIEFD